MFMQALAYAHAMEDVQSQSTACLPPSASASVHGRCWRAPLCSHNNTGSLLNTRSDDASATVGVLVSRSREGTASTPSTHEMPPGPPRRRRLPAGLRRRRQLLPLRIAFRRLQTCLPRDQRCSRAASPPAAPM